MQYDDMSSWNLSISDIAYLVLENTWAPTLTGGQICKFGLYNQSLDMCHTNTPDRT